MGAIERIDLDSKRVDVRLTKDQIKESPEYDANEDHTSPSYRDRLGTYYGSYV